MSHKSKNCCCKCLLGTFLYIFILLLVCFLIVFVIIPVAFKYSPGIQRSLIFPTWYISPKNYSDVEKYASNKYISLAGINNFYINVDQSNNITLGVWQILPEDMLSEFIRNDKYNYDGALANEKYNILIYLHGNGNDRTNALDLYKILRKYFHIFAVDYRGYGDSSRGEMRDDLIVNDIVEVYKWLRERSKSNIFIWGHSLGTGVSTHVISNLNAQKYKPTGLILETPFTSVSDVIEDHPFVKFYSWLPWYRQTFIDPIIENGLDFNSKKYIVDVECPIMMLHAKDDSIIDYKFSDKLFEVAVRERNLTAQGNVTYHLFEALGYDHMYLFLAPELPDFVKRFIDICLDFLKRRT